MSNKTLVNDQENKIQKFGHKKKKWLVGLAIVSLITIIAIGSTGIIIAVRAEQEKSEPQPVFNLQEVLEDYQLDAVKVRKLALNAISSDIFEYINEKTNIAVAVLNQELNFAWNLDNWPYEIFVSVDPESSIFFLDQEKLTIPIDGDNLRIFEAIDNFKGKQPYQEDYLDAWTKYFNSMRDIFLAKIVRKPVKIKNGDDIQISNRLQSYLFNLIHDTRTEEHEQLGLPHEVVSYKFSLVEDDIIDFENNIYTFDFIKLSFTNLEENAYMWVGENVEVHFELI
ncbi:MAG: hypothetical protein REH79_01050 [Spiroplasma sp.]|nr:hypothetical protein [Spiroplasma sp.]